MAVQAPKPRRGQRTTENKDRQLIQDCYYGQKDGKASSDPDIYIATGRERDQPSFSWTSLKMRTRPSQTRLGALSPFFYIGIHDIRAESGWAGVFGDESVGWDVAFTQDVELDQGML